MHEAVGDDASADRDANVGDVGQCADAAARLERETVMLEEIRRQE